MEAFHSMVPEDRARKAALGTYVLRTSLPTGSTGQRPNELTQVVNVSSDMLSLGVRLTHVVQSLLSDIINLKSKLLLCC